MERYLIAKIMTNSALNFTKKFEKQTILLAMFSYVYLDSMSNT